MLLSFVMNWSDLMIRDDSIKFYCSFVIQACVRRLFTDRQNRIVGVGKTFLAKITKNGLKALRVYLTFFSLNYID